MALLVEPSDDAAVQHRRRRGGAEAEAIDRLQRDARIGRGISKRNAELCFRARSERIAARSLAGFGAAQFQHMAAGGLVAEVMIEGEDAMDFGARQIERRGDHRNRRLRHIAERFLQRVQDHQRRAFGLVMFGDDLGAARLVPGFVNRCHPRSRSEGFGTLIETWNCSKYQ